MACKSSVDRVEVDVEIEAYIQVRSKLMMVTSQSDLHTHRWLAVSGNLEPSKHEQLNEAAMLR